MDVIIDAGTLEFNEDDLSASGIAVPFGVKARSNLGEFEVDPGTFELPADATGLPLNVEHRREDVVGGVTRVWEQPEGILAAMRFANTPQGRQAFADAKAGKRKHLSVEAANVKIRGGRAIAGRVFGLALVERPAFAGATLLAAEDTEASTPLDTALGPDEDGHLTVLSTTLPTDITVSTPEGEQANYTPEAAPAEENTEGGSTVTATATQPGHTSAPVVPTTLLAGSTSAPKGPQAQDDIDLGSVFASMAAIKNGMSNQTSEAETLLAALSDITYNTTGGLTTSASGILQPAWVGKLWQGLRYVRKYLDLGTHLYGGIQLGGRRGFTIDQGTALVQHWAGNKTEIPTGKATTGTKSSTLQKYAYGADVAREWYDLEGGADVLQAFFEGVRDSYAELTDEDALKAIIAAGLPNLESTGTYPTDYPAAMGQLIDAIEAVADNGDEATFAIVNRAAYRELLFTPKDLVPEFVSFAFRAGTGQGTADGKVSVVRADDSYFTGLDPDEPAVVAGAKRAIEFREQGTTPIEIDALNIAKGGIDKAVIGYMETFVVRPESFVAFGTASA